MRNKYVFNWLSIASLASLPLLTIGCSTTWMRWKPAEGKQTKYEFIHQKEDRIKYEIRELETLRLAYDEKNEILDLSKINNHYELIALLGDITNIKFPKGQTLEKFWKEKKWKGNLWSEDKTGFFDKISKKISFAIKYKDVISAKIEIDFEEELTSIVSGFKQNKGKYFDLEGAIKSGMLKINENGIPEKWMNFGELGDEIGEMARIPTISALTRYRTHAAALLSKLVNFPKESFIQFITFIYKIDQFLNEFWNTNPITDWNSNENINWEIDQEGYIVKNSTDDWESLFKAKFIIYSLF